MNLLVTCSRCQTQLRTRPENAGKSIRCWSCRTEVLVPTAKPMVDPALQWGPTLSYPLRRQKPALFGAIGIALTCVAVPARGLNELFMAAGLLVTLTILGVSGEAAPDNPETVPRSWLRSAVGALMAGGVILAGLGPRTVKTILAFNRHQTLPLWVSEALAGWLVICFLVAPAVWLAVTTRGWPWAANPWTVGRTLWRLGRAYLAILLVMIAAIVVTELIDMVISLVIDILSHTDIDRTAPLRWGTRGSALYDWWYGIGHGQLLLWEIPVWFSDAVYSQSWLREGYLHVDWDALLLVGMLAIVVVTAAVGAYTWAVVVHRLDLLTTPRRPESASLPVQVIFGGF